MTLNEINEAAEIITEGADSEAQILFGAVVDPELGDQVSVTVIATGFSRVPDGAQLPATQARSSVETASSRRAHRRAPVDSWFPEARTRSTASTRPTITRFRQYCANKWIEPRNHISGVPGGCPADPSTPSATHLPAEGEFF